MPHCGLCARYVRRDSPVILRQVDERICAFGSPGAYPLTSETRKRHVCAACAVRLDAAEARDVPSD